MIAFNLSVLVLLCNLKALDKSAWVSIEHLNSDLEQVVRLKVILEALLVPGSVDIAQFGASQWVLNPHHLQPGKIIIKNLFEIS